MTTIRGPFACVSNENVKALRLSEIPPALAPTKFVRCITYTCMYSPDLLSQNLKDSYFLNNYDLSINEVCMYSIRHSVNSTICAHITIRTTLLTMQ